MTTLDREYEDIVRRALDAAAESIVPAGDGLHRIRHRLDSPRSMNSLAAGFAEWLRLSGIRFSVRLEPATETGRTALGQVRHLFTGPGLLPGPFLTRGQPPEDHPRRRRTAPSHRARSRLGPAAAWLLPALAAAGVVIVVFGVAFGLHRVQQTVIRPTNADSAQSAGTARPAAAATTEPASLQPWAPLGVVPPALETAGTSQQQGTVHTLMPAVACSANASSSPATPVAAASATPTPTVTPTNVTPTPTPTVTPTVTPTQVVTPTPTESGVGTNGSDTTQATAAAYFIPAAAQQPASTGCGGTPVTATPAASPTGTAAS